MKATTGGTYIFCPGCEDTTCCKAIPVPKITLDSDDYGQRRYFGTHPDVNFFQRGRLCLDCGHEFVTGEVELAFLDELIDLRDALRDVKRNAESYRNEAKAAAKSLQKLSRSLDVLRALDIYKKAD